MCYCRVSELSIISDVLKNYIDAEQADPVHKQRYYLTVKPFYLIRKRQHTKYLSLLHSRCLYYTIVSQFEDTEAIMKQILVE